MAARLVWLAGPVLIGVIGSACADSPVAVVRTPPQVSSDVTAAIAQQSPIDIRGDELVIEKVQEVPPLWFHYAMHATVDLENTGSPSEESTVRANVTPGDGELRVDGVDYRLVQFHWNIPAEHEVDGQRFPMEMHFVHNGTDGSTLVIGVFLRTGTRTKP